MDQNKTLPHGLQVPDWTGQTRLAKAATLAVLAIICFGLAWQWFAAGLARPHELGFWLGPLVLAGLAIAYLALLAIVNTAQWIFLATNLAILGWYLIVLPKDWFVVTGGVLLFLLSFLFERRIRSDEKTRADFALSRIIRGSINLMVYALLIAVGFNVYYKISQDFETHPERFYAQVGHYAARGLELIPSEFGDLTPELRDVVAGAAAERIQKAAAKNEKFFPAIFAVIIVALLRAVAFLFIWLTELMAWLVFKLLLKLKFFRIEKVQVEVNKLQI